MCCVCCWTSQEADMQRRDALQKRQILLGNVELQHARANQAWDAVRLPPALLSICLAHHELHLVTVIVAGTVGER